MLIIRLLHLKDIPSYESLLDTLKKSNSNEAEKEIKTKNLIKFKLLYDRNNSLNKKIKLEQIRKETV